jgi:uncharacterized membrane protein YphA (DoxX/SURF4 family)
MSKIILVLRVIVAIILLQTLYFKFSAHPDSIHIFETVGMEPWGRIGTGIVELIAGILLLIPRTSWIGAGMAFGVISGAVVMHLTLLGIEVNSDGGQLFYMALFVFIASGIILWFEKDKILAILKRS